MNPSYEINLFDSHLFPVKAGICKSESDQTDSADPIVSPSLIWNDLFGKVGALLTKEEHKSNPRNDDTFQIRDDPGNNSNCPR